ncbi:MAG: hypothetical protein ACOC1F_03980 [Myxococcota bacterium]
MLRWLLHPVSRPARWILVVGALARVALLFAGPRVLDRAFVVDDAYYTLTLARSLVLTGMPSADGAEVTSGYQPLLALFQAPAFLVGASPDAGLLWGLAILLTADVLCALLLARLAARAAGPIGSITAAALWSLSPVAVTEALVGLEGTLAVAMTLLSAALVAHLHDAPTRRNAALLGVTLGACLLARIDTAWFVTFVGTWLLLRHRRLLPFAIGPALVVFGPWLAFCLFVSGRPWPESGDAVRSLIDEGDTLVSTARCAGWATGYVIPGVLTDPEELRQTLVEHPAAGAAGCLATLVAGGWFAARAPTAVRLWLFGALALVPFYVLALPAIWGFRRYLFPARAGMTLVYACLLAMAWERIRHTVPRWSPWLALPVLAGHFALLLATSLRAPARGSMDRSTGYRAAAIAIFAQLPPGSRLGAFQSGALGYFRPDDITVINLDGVVSGSAHRAFVEHRLGQHLRDRGATHVTDWKAGLRVLFERWDDDEEPKLFRLYEAPPQGERRFILAKIAWPPG